MTNATLRGFQENYEAAETKDELLSLRTAIMGQVAQQGSRPAARDLVDTINWRLEKMLHEKALREGTTLLQAANG